MGLTARVVRPCSGSVAARGGSGNSLHYLRVWVIKLMLELQLPKGYTPGMGGNRGGAKKTHV